MRIRIEFVELLNQKKMKSLERCNKQVNQHLQAEIELKIY